MIEGRPISVFPAQVVCNGELFRTSEYIREMQWKGHNLQSLKQRRTEKQIVKCFQRVAHAAILTNHETKFNRSFPTEGISRSAGAFPLPDRFPRNQRPEATAPDGREALH